MLEHRGYRGRVEFDDEAGIFSGEVLGLRDVVTFSGRSVDELEETFRDSVDDYLEFCKERGEEPDKPFGGKLLVRLGPEKHREIVLKAQLEGKSVNQWVTEKLTR